MPVDLSLQEADAVSRAGREAVLAVNRALDRLVKGESDVALRSIDVVSRADLGGVVEKLLPGPPAQLVAVHAGATGQEGGATLLLLTQSEAHLFADVLLGAQEGATKRLDAAGSSALREAASVLGQAAFGALNQALGRTTIPGVPRVLPAGRDAVARAMQKSFREADALVLHSAFDLAFGQGARGILLVFSPASSEPALKTGLAAAGRRQAEEAAPSGAPRVVPPGPIAPEGEPFPLSPAPRVLLVDDSLYFRTLMTRMLSHCGVKEVAGTGDPSQALTLYRMHRPDVVLLDMLMEGKSGMRVLREIRDLDPDAKVLVISAVSQELMVGECLRQGAKGFLVKPVSASRLSEEIRRIVVPGATGGVEKARATGSG